MQSGNFAAAEGVADLVSVLLDRPAVVGAQRPRIEVIPDGDEHPRWRQIRDIIGDLGIVLDEWQERVLWASLLRRGTIWAAFAVAVCAPRQNGKNGILEARELAGPLLLGERLLIHSAHLADTSKEGFRRLDDLVDANGWLERRVAHIWRTNGHEAIEFTDGSRIRFRTRTRGGGRGFSGSPVVFDEAMFLPEVSMGAILPIVSAQPDPQVWYTGSAVDQEIHEDGVVFARVRDRALSGEDPRLAYFEWSVDAENPDQVDDAIAADIEAIRVSNPALGIRISAEYVEAERRELDPRTFAVERLGVGDWPPVDGTAALAIPLETWDELADDPESQDARMLDPVCFAFDVTPDRSRSAIAAAGRRTDGNLQIEVVDHRRGTAWVAPRLAELAERHELVAVICDGYSPAASLEIQCQEAGVEVQVLNSTEQAKACGVLFDSVDNRAVRHLGSRELRAAIRGATKRRLGDAWAWSRTDSTIDISPLVAATLALWGVAAAQPQDSGVIYG